MSAGLVHLTFGKVYLDIRVEREGRRDSSAPCAVINEQASERANQVKERGRGTQLLCCQNKWSKVARMSFWLPQPLKVFVGRADYTSTTYKNCTLGGVELKQDTGKPRSTVVP